MLDRIFKLGKEAAIYGLSSIVGRFLNFLLVPLYTNYLATAEYGVVANTYAYIAFAGVIYGYGMDSAYMRFVASLEKWDKKQAVSVPLVSLTATSLLFSFALYISAPLLADLLGIEHAEYVRYSAGILFFDTMMIVPFAYLRMENRARMFAGMRILSIVITIILTVIFLVVLHMKAETVFIAGLIASGITAITLLV